MSKTYEYKVKPEPYQHEAVVKALKRKTFGVFFEQRVGKTRVGVDFAGALYTLRGLTNVLVVCPISAIGAWQTQIPQYLPEDIPHWVSRYTARKPIHDHMTLVGEKITKMLHFLIATYDQIRADKQAIEEWGPQVIIADEVHKIKNHASKRSRALYKLRNMAEYRLGLTGTPAAQKPTDLFGIFKFIDPTIYGESWPKFRSKFCVMGGYMNYEVVNYKNLDDLQKRMSHASIRVLRKDVLTEPEIEETVVSRTMEPVAKHHYTNMKKAFLTKLDSGSVVLGDLPIVRLMRLQQIAGGFLKDPETEEITCVNRSKFNLLEEIVTEILEDDEKIVIFTKYTPEVQEIYRRCSALAGTVVIDGSVTGIEREKRIKAFQTKDEAQIIILQIGAGNSGFSLSASHRVIFYSMSFSITEYLQAKDRVMGREQESAAVTYYFLASEKTVDEKIIADIRAGIDVASKVTDAFKYYVE